MSHITIVNKSQLFAAATAITAVGFLTASPPAQAHPMLPLAPDCSQWDSLGQWDSLAPFVCNAPTAPPPAPATSGLLAPPPAPVSHQPVPPALLPTPTP